MHADLVDAQWLRSHLNDPAVRVLDCTTFMTPQPVGPSRIDSGRPNWEQARIPGSRHVCMVEDLSDPQGRYPYTLPSTRQVLQRLAAKGVAPHHHLVLYGTSHPMVVTRAWWVLTTLGWPRVSLLNGGLQAWEAAGGVIERGPAPAADPLPSQSALSSQSGQRPVAPQDALQDGMPSESHARPRRATAEDVARASESGSAWLVNALSLEQFTGSGGAHYGRPGRIPGSLSLPAREMLDAQTGRWLDPEGIRQRAYQAGLTDDGRAVIVYCGGGIAATATAFALERAGWAQVQVYDNSLLEWSVDPARPMIRD
jgi:thiosulfate/3-mercaptopyruvate sulfurtransferase